MAQLEIPSAPWPLARLDESGAGPGSGVEERDSLGGRAGEALSRPAARPWAGASPTPHLWGEVGSLV